MAKNTSILLGDYFNAFIKEQVRTGKFSSASEVVRAALRLFEYEENKKEELIKALQKGEASGRVDTFDPESFIDKMHRKYASEK